VASFIKLPEPLVFGLDIGTRSIVGTVGYKEQDKFNVVAMAVKYHDSRSMIDGQIHDIAKVSEDILYVKNELEKQLPNRKLSDVCIAAAGRVLKTAVGRGEYEFAENTVITQEYIHSIDLIGVEKAHEQIREELSASDENGKYYCVGYTVIKYYLNGFEIQNLEGHRGSRIEADVLATFLPEEVVSSLYSAVEQAGLYVSNLTLEPIAAINVAIPEQYRLLNIALVDVGAGTSDISITKDGSIIGYGMIPYAGDELTETLVKKYLIDFETAEKLKTVGTRRKSITYKDIMGISHKVSSDEILETADAVNHNITKSIAEKIIELNGNTAVSAVFVVGGGGKIPGFTKYLAQELGLPEERVALRGQEVMNDIHFLVDDFKKDSLYVTPIGICLNYFDQKNNFMFVTVNDERIKLYNNDKLTIFDAAVQYGLPNEDIFAKRGADITFKINGKTRIARGYSGEPARIELNGKDVGMNALIEADDVIHIKKSTVGDSAHIELASLPEYSGTITFTVNETTVTCPKFAMVNGKPESSLYEIKDGDDIEMQNFYTLEQLFTFMDVEPVPSVYVNNAKANPDTRIFDNFIVNWIRDEELREYVNKVNTEDKNHIADEAHLDSVEVSDTNEADEITDINEIKKVNTDKGREGIVELHVLVNDTPVTLTGKTEYRFVDVLDFYDFDIKEMQGKKLITNQDGHHVEFIELLHENSILDLYWEK
jgi:cell division protein FtsA